MPEIFVRDPDLTIICGDVKEALATLPDNSVDCVVTSPPYWGLRDYGEAGQIGLESTPEQYVEKMVEVFREVRRVLAAHGTVWLNLGDSYYAAGWESRRRNEVGAGSFAPEDRRSHTGIVDGLKVKDLVGIPWMLAKALQAPYYTGKIRDERERIWLAATIEAEGCLFIHKRGVGQYASSFTKKDGTESHYHRKNATYGAGLEVASTDRVIVERCMAITGLGSISEQSPEQNERRKQTIYRWNLRSNVCREVIRELYPHLIAKQHEARLLLGCPSSGDKAERAHESLKALHQGGTPDIDFAAPESMFEGGWYLRSDIIWSKKPNPMPESVTDRPTKAHEYLFLLSKQPRYFFDQEAVREPAEWNRWGDQTNDKYEGTKSGAGWIQSKTKYELMMRGRQSYPPGGTTGNRGSEHIKGGSGGMPSSHPSGRNIRSVWSIPTQPYADAHFATFPMELPRRAIKAGCPAEVCNVCGKPRERIVEREVAPPEIRKKDETTLPTSESQDFRYHDFSGQRYQDWLDAHPPETIGWTDCGHNSYRKGVVLDPFFGSGTTGLAAREIERDCIGIDLSKDYCEIAARRLQQLSLFAGVPLAGDDPS